MSIHTQTWKFVLSACLFIECGGYLCGQSITDPSPNPRPNAGSTPTHGAANFYPGAAAVSGVASTGILAEGALPFVVFAADFNSGNNGFTYIPDPDAPSNLWHRTPVRLADQLHVLRH